MKVNQLTKSIAIVLGSSIVFNNGFVAAAESDAASNQTTDESAESRNENKIIITGSRIKRANVEGPSPVIRITSDDMERQGHATVYDAIKASAVATGGDFVGEQSSNNFTANAAGIELRGFGVGRSLVLLNGRRIPIVPTPFGGTDNFVNYNMIPAAAVDHIDILTEGASAIYGSDAVSGVINIVTKTDYEGVDVLLRAGDTHDGGGDSTLLQITGGYSNNKSSLTAGIEIYNRNPIFGKDRDYLDDITDNPRHDPESQLSNVEWNFARWRNSDGYLQLSDDFCEGLPGGLSAGVSGTSRGNPRSFCYRDSTGSATIRNASDRASAFANYQYKISPDTKLFADFLYFTSESESNLSWRPWWSENISVVGDLNDPNGTWIDDIWVNKRFAPSETPQQEQRFEEEVTMFTAGINGIIGSDLEYNISLTSSRYDADSFIRQFGRNEIQQAMLGFDPTDPARRASWGYWLLTADEVDANMVPNAGTLNLTSANTPDMFEGVLVDSTVLGESKSDSVSADLTGTLFELDAGPLQFALVAEFSKESYDLIPDEVSEGGGLYAWGATGGGGERKHMAIGSEFSIPLLAEDSAIGSLEAIAALRYDKYDDDSNVDGAATYKVGLAWRPSDDLLVRTGYSTSFRAPDLHRLYAKDQEIFFNSTLDLWACRDLEIQDPSNTLETCNETSSVRGAYRGDLELKEEEGYNFNLGIVYNITDNWDVTLDMYQVQLEDIVDTFTPSDVIREESSCRIGEDFDGQAVDINSAFCQEMIDRVTRDYSGQNPGAYGTVTDVRIKPFNTALREQTGLDLRSAYKVDTDMGNFKFTLNYSYTDEIKIQERAQDPIDDEFREDLWNTQLRSKVNLDIAWYHGDFDANLYINRRGSVPQGRRGSDDGDVEISGRFSPWTTANMTFGYSITDSSYVRLGVNNVANKRPPTGRFQTSWPYYDWYAHNATGREYFLTYIHSFK